LGNSETVGLTVDVGRFEYKYNPESRNLGEYLFRTGTYPAYITTSFDLPLARVTGIKASLKLWDWLRQDLLVTTLTDIEPFTDITLTYIADASLLGNALDLGAGVQFANAISTNPSQTSTHDFSQNGYYSAPGDTAYYTFRGTKLLGRFMLDPKRFFNGTFVNNILGKEDGKIYVEAAVLGLESYPASNDYGSTKQDNLYGYDQLWQKIPVTMGFNVPTFRIFDVLSLEAEWYGCRYPDAYKGVVINDIAVPTTRQSSYGG